MKNPLKKLTAIFALLVAFTMCFSLAGCNKEKEKTMQEDFAEFYSEKNQENSEYLFLKTKSGAQIWNISFEKEEASKPRVVIDFEFDSSYTETAEYKKNMYNYICQSTSQIKSDLKGLGDMVVEYAKEKKWDNNYYLYVVLSLYEYHNDFVYNYETDTLYVPKKLSVVKEMYKNFSTFYQPDIAKMDGGTEWLVSKELGTIKHGEYEGDYDALESYSVWISQGKFVTTDIKLSNAV